MFFKLSPKKKQHPAALAVMVCLIVTAAFFILSLSIPGIAAAAVKPYEYYFVSGAGEPFNGIGNTSTLVVKFDHAISYDHATVDEAKKIYVVLGNSRLDDDIIKSVTTDEVNKTITVAFKNLEMLDYTQSLACELVIPRETLAYNQLVEYRLPFNIYESLPGFKSTFMDNDATVINKIFQDNAPRDIYIHVPKQYITGIETIHRYQGPVPGRETVSLSNIDVLTDADVTRMKVNVDDFPDGYRDLQRRNDINGFTMGQAGLEVGSAPGDGEDYEMSEEMSLRAFDENGKFLVEETFKLRVTDLENDFIVNDYIDSSNASSFGKKYTLYQLMKDKTTLENIISKIPVDDLDTLGVTYSFRTAGTTVSDLQQLTMALANGNIDEIVLAGVITGDITVNRSVTITGNNHNINGNVTLGTGRNINVTLQNMTIHGDLTVDVGASGYAVLDNVVVNGVTIIRSGGVNSIHLNNFITPQLNIYNLSPVRVRTTGVNSIGKTYISGNSAVTLEAGSASNFGNIYIYSPVMVNFAGTAKFGDVYVSADATLDIPDGMEIGTMKYGITVADVVGGTATVTTNPADEAVAGTTVTVTIADIEGGKRFKSITVKNANNVDMATTEVTAGKVYTFIMPAKAVTVTVEVEAIKYGITVADVEGGTATVTTNPANEAAAGASVTVTIANIEGGKQFKSIEVKDADSNVVATNEEKAGEQYTFTMPAKAVTVTVTLEANP